MINIRRPASRTIPVADRGPIITPSAHLAIKEDITLEMTPGSHNRRQQRGPIRRPIRPPAEPPVPGATRWRRTAEALASGHRCGDRGGIRCDRVSRSALIHWQSGVTPGRSSADPLARCEVDASPTTASEGAGLSVSPLDHMASPLVRWLAEGTADELATILTRRPDPLGPPKPADLADIATRLQSPGSVATALAALPRPARR